METLIALGPSNTVAEVRLRYGETCTTEAGAMIAMSPDLSIETSTHKKNKGGIGKALKRLFAGESFFMNHYTAQKDARLFLAPTLSGDIFQYPLSGGKIIIQSGSFLACEEKVDIDTGWQGFQSIFSGESLFWLEASGQGKVLVSAFGSIYCVEVEDNYIVDTGHIVAFEDSLKFNLSKAGSSWLHSIAGGEGIVCRFTGKGKVWCQSHNPSSFGFALQPHLKTR
ncbi:MAG: TIGR00266 family protein [Oligoflexales bacterium]